MTRGHARRVALVLASLATLFVVVVGATYLWAMHASAVVPDDLHRYPSRC